MAESRPDFQRTQYEFAAAIRGPEPVRPPQGVTTERLDLYRQLIFNNLDSFIASGFPVLHELLDRDSWQALIRDFLAGHRSTTPYFSGIPAEFLNYLHDERGDHPEDPPFLLELAHYEWVELALSLDQGETPAEDPALIAAPLDLPLMLSPTAWPLTYRYPVQRISRDHQPLEPPAEPTYLAVYRDREDQVRFLELNAVTYRLLCLIDQESGLPGIVHLDRVATELGYPETAPLLDYGAELLCDLARRGVIGSLGG